MEETDAMLHPPTQALFLGRPADVRWVPADRIAEAGPDWGGNQRHFESLRQAIEFVMQGLTIADRANVWIVTEEGNLMLEQIEQLQ
jgi:hypothetical protein